MIKSRDIRTGAASRGAASAGALALAAAFTVASFVTVPLAGQTQAPARGAGAAPAGNTPATAPKPAAAPAASPAATSGSALNLTATSANVKTPGSPVKIRLVRWSTEEERTPLLTALNPPPPPPPGAGGDRAGGAGRAGRGGAPAAAPGRGGRAGGRGGRGDAAPVTPIAAFTAALGKAPTLGYIWTNDVTGYSIKYAWHAPLPDGGERVILSTDRRLGAYAPAWAPAGAAQPTDYEFTVFELRLDPKGAGEGKTSLTSKVVVEDDTKTVALEDYAAAPAILQNVKREAGADRR